MEHRSHLLSSLSLNFKGSGPTLVFQFEADLDPFLQAAKPIFYQSFFSSRRQQKWSDYLYTVKQKEDESIRVFVSCFNVAILKVCDLDQSVVISTMISGLLKNDLKRSLVKTYPQNYPNMLIRVEKYAYMEEIFIKDEAPTNPIRGGK